MTKPSLSSRSYKRLFSNLSPQPPLCKDFIYLFQGRGSGDWRGAMPLSKISSPVIGIYIRITESQREAKPLLYNQFPPLLKKERGINGVRLINNLTYKP